MTLGQREVTFIKELFRRCMDTVTLFRVEGPLCWQLEDRCYWRPRELRAELNVVVGYIVLTSRRHGRRSPEVWRGGRCFPK